MFTTKFIPPNVMSKYITIALDAMGGDYGPSVTVPAALQALRENKDIKVILVGDQDIISQQLSQNDAAENERIVIQHATQTVEMHDLPSFALRNKKDSSMRIAINLVKEGVAEACVSAGNTGALMATARFVLKMVSGVDRPAIIVTLPTIKGHTHVLDMGANVDTSAENLFEFAVMASALVSAVENSESPTIGLLNIGEEEIKGNERVKEAARLLSASNLNYIGYVEGDDIYKGTADVIVCDGFVGNVALKTTEGLAKLIQHYMTLEYKRNIFTMLAGIISMPVLKAFRKRIDPRRYNGASLLGLKGIVIKSHGGADILSFACAIREARLEVLKNVPQKIGQQLDNLLAERQAV